MCCKNPWKEYKWKRTGKNHSSKHMFHKHLNISELWFSNDLLIVVWQWLINESYHHPFLFSFPFLQCQLAWCFVWCYVDLTYDCCGYHGEAIYSPHEWKGVQMGMKVGIRDDGKEVDSCNLWTLLMQMRHFCSFSLSVSLALHFVLYPFFFALWFWSACFWWNHVRLDSVCVGRSLTISMS